jgi:hypothetical protein
MILILAILSPAWASAQDTGPAATDEAPAVVTAQAPTAARPADRKRRGSMVGYIADSSIESYVRVRFDSGFNNKTPDRAEFFYAQCGCNSATAPGPGAPGAGDLANKLNFQQLGFDVQYAATPRIAVFASIPTRFVQPQSFLGQTFKPPLPNTFVSQSGFGDIRAGVKAAILTDEEKTLTGQFQIYFNSGDAKKGLGTAHGSIDMALLYYQRVAPKVAIESQFGDVHPTGGSTAPTGASYAGDVLYYGIGPSFEVYRTPRLVFAPVVELVGWHVNGGQVQDSGNLGSASTNIVNLKFGARTTFDERNSIYVGYGHALTDAVWYTDILRIEYRYSF